MQRRCHQDTLACSGQRCLTWQRYASCCTAVVAETEFDVQHRPYDCCGHIRMVGLFSCAWQQSNICILLLILQSRLTKECSVCRCCS